MRVTRTLAALAAALLVAASPASAHEGNPDFRSTVTSVTPETQGLDIEVVNFDDSFQLTNNSSSDVLILGYEDEPYALIKADGTVELNRNSPAFYLNDERFADVEVPGSVDPDDPPDWEVVDRSGQLSWHDHRMHWMSTSLPPQVTDESKETKVFDYSVPIEIDGRPGSIDGTLTWVGKDGSVPIAPMVGLSVVALAAVGFVFLRKRRDTGDGGREAW